MSPLSQHIEVNIMMELVRYYPLDLDPIVRQHVCIIDSTVCYSDIMGYNFAVSSKRLRRLWFREHSTDNYIHIKNHTDWGISIDNYLRRSN